MDGIEGFQRVLAELNCRMRFRDFLRVSVLLYGGAATALAVVSVVGATRADTNTLVYVAAVWWCVAALVGLWLGRRLATDRRHRAPAGGRAQRPTRFRSSSPER